MADDTDKSTDALPDLRSSGKEVRPGNEAATNRPATDLNLPERLRLFEAATERQRARETLRSGSTAAEPPEGRGWTREDLYC